MVIGHKIIHNLNHSFFIVFQAVLPAIAMSVKHNCDKSCAARCRNNTLRFVAERRLNGLAGAGFNRRFATNRIVVAGSTG